MDVIYCFGDSFSYRTPARDYEQFPIEETKKKAQARPKHQPTQKKETSKTTRCELCREKERDQNKRPLKSQIKRCANRTESICEEAEES